MHNTPEANQAFRETWDENNRRYALLCLELAEEGSEEHAHWTRILAAINDPTRPVKQGEASLYAAQQTEGT